MKSEIVPLAFVESALEQIKDVSSDNSIHMIGRTEEEKQLIRHIVTLCAIPVNVLIKNS